jgi:hypothetical protein
MKNRSKGKNRKNAGSERARPTFDGASSPIAGAANAPTSAVPVPGGGPFLLPTVPPPAQGTLPLEVADPIGTRGQGFPPQAECLPNPGRRRFLSGGLGVAGDFFTRGGPLLSPILVAAAGGGIYEGYEMRKANLSAIALNKQNQEHADEVRAKEIARQDEQRREELWRPSAPLRSFNHFCELVRKNKFDEAADAALDRANAAIGNDNKREQYVWEANRCIAQAFAGNASSIVNLMSVLRGASSSGACDEDWLYAATLDLIYLKLLFYASDPRNAHTSFEKKAYAKLEARTPVNFRRVLQLEYLFGHVFELSPALMVEQTQVSTDFLYTKVLALRGQFREALYLLQNECRTNWAGNREVLAPIGLAEPFVMASLGNSEGALRQANSVDLSAVIDHAARAHMEAVIALFRRRSEYLAGRLRHQSQQGRHLLAWVLRGDCAFYLSGHPAKGVRRDYVTAGLFGYQKAKFDGVDEFRSSLLKLAS